MSNTTATIEIPAAQAAAQSPSALRMLIPTGRIQERVLTLLDQVGVSFSAKNRCYKPICKDSGIEGKMLKAQNVPMLIALGRQDCGFSGYDWIVEQEADVVELLDLGFDPVRIIAAMPEELAEQGKAAWQARKLVIASKTI
jgi:ATP phosphoribosyltransferase